MPEKNKIKVAVIQMASNANKCRNLKRAVKFINKAVNNRAQFILLPEMFNLRGRNAELISQAEKVNGPSIKQLRIIAAKNKVWILAGSISEKASVKNKAYNTSVLIDNHGKVKCKYRKMHLFDVSLGNKTISESRIYLRGQSPVLTSIMGVKAGLAVCYDLRFPELFRRYTKNGAKMLCIPSSFVFYTGKAHWETLLKARAIENQCFVIAPNQCGAVGKGLKTYGNSMVIDPWGRILAKASGNQEEIIYADLDFANLTKIRKDFPALNHRVL